MYTENQTNIGDQNVQQTGQNLVNQQAMTPERPRTNQMMIAGIIVTCLMFFGFGGYYLGRRSADFQQNSSNTQSQSGLAVTSETSISTASPTSFQQSASLPSGWRYKDNGECGVRFAIPPDEVPYRSDPIRWGADFWDFPRGGVYPDLLSMIFLPDQSEYEQAVTMFASDDTCGGSGYISQAVAVSCVPNNGRFADNDALVSSLAAGIDEFNILKPERMGPSTYTIKSYTPKTRWSKDVVDLVVTEDIRDVSYTMFVTPQYIYEVKIIGETSDPFVKDTAKKIFDYLVFW